MSHDIEMPHIDQQVPTTRACEHISRCPVCHFEKMMTVLESILHELRADFKRHHDPEIQVGHLTPVVETPETLPTSESPQE